MNSFISTTISLTLGTTIIVGGVAVDAEKIIGDAQAAVNKANVHQFATVLELYHLDHGRYPQVEGGEALVNTLLAEGYIRNRPLDASEFVYEPKDNGLDYTLALRE